MRLLNAFRALSFGKRSAEDQSDASPVRAGHLFIIGSARSGTTILQNALNHSESVFLLGEPDIHRENDEPGFRERYNTQHRSWSNEETKSTFLPPVLEADRSWRDYFAWLTRRYRWVGTKVVANAIRAPDEMARLFAFHAREFYGARYIFTFRDPFLVIASTRGLQILSGGPVEDLQSLAASYAAVVALYVKMARNLPFVRCLFHEHVRQDTFDGLSGWLGISMDGCASYYDVARVRQHVWEGLTDHERSLLAFLSGLYTDLRAETLEGVSRSQLEQNDANPDPAHYTRLGSIDRRARFIAGPLLAQHFDRKMPARERSAGMDLTEDPRG